MESKTTMGRSGGIRCLSRLFAAAVVVMVAAAAGILATGAAQAAAVQRMAAEDGAVYVVQPGDSLADIAAAHGTTIAAIMEANGLRNANLLVIGQRLVLPAAAPEPGGEDPTGRGVYHVVRVGETLVEIAEKYGASASAVIRANGIRDPDVIWIGQRLYIPGVGSRTPAPGTSTATPALPRGTPTPTPEKPAATPGTPKPAPTEPTPTEPAPTEPAPTPAGPTIHTVQPGDTLARIAAAYETTVAAIVKVNSLPGPDLITVGTRLIIPPPNGRVPAFSGQASSFVASISQQTCWLYQDEELLAEWECSTGRPGWPTVPGSYRVQSKIAKAYGSTWDIWMPYWLGIYWAGGSENGIHGLPWNATTGAQTWTGMVGTRITYGCIMLDNVNAKMLYDMSYIGMPVIVKP